MTALTAGKLIELLSCIEPDTEVGISTLRSAEPIKSMIVENNMLCFTASLWTNKDEDTFNLKKMISSLSHFAKPSEYDKGYQDGLKAAKEEYKQTKIA